MRRRTTGPSPGRRCLTGWLAVLLSLFALSPVGTGVTALVAAASPDHELQIGGGADGVALVLHHQGHCVQHHQHGRAARLLTLLANSRTDTDPDHVILFQTSATALSEARAEVPAGPTDGVAAGSPAEYFSAGQTTPPLPAALWPPPERRGSLGGIHTTVLRL